MPEREELLTEALKQARARDGLWQPLQISYGADIDQAIDLMTCIINDGQHLTDTYPARWVALKYLENDEEIIRIGRSNNEIAERLERQAPQNKRTLSGDPEHDPRGDHCRLPLWHDQFDPAPGGPD